MSTELIVAIIGSVGLVLAAAIPVTLNRRDIKHVRDNVGQKNGQGNAIQMLELVLDNQKNHAELDRLQFLGIAARMDLHEHLLTGGTWDTWKPRALPPELPEWLLTQVSQSPSPGE